MTDLLSSGPRVPVEWPIGNSSRPSAAAVVPEDAAIVLEALVRHISAALPAELAQAQAWAAAHPLWTHDDVEASRRWWRSPGAIAPLDGETWIVAGDSGRLVVGTWRRVLRCDDELAWTVGGAVEPVAASTMAQLWLGLDAADLTATTRQGLQAAWGDHLAGRRAPSWLCDVGAVEGLPGTLRREPRRNRNRSRCRGI